MPAANDVPEAAPPVAAIFLVVFDKKVGYKIAWKRHIAEVDLSGVDFKSLPSGLHNVEQDLVYFTHGDYAGISAFSNKPGSAADRNATFLAVGVLVSLSYGRLGRSWMHAHALKELSSTYPTNDDGKDKHEALENYWRVHQIDTAGEQTKAAAFVEPSTPAGVKPELSSKRRSRALSDAAGFSVRNHLLSSDHPALSMPDFLDAFGPLVFPLYKAALLRKRILLLGPAPIQRSCNFVYNLSIFSNIPVPIMETLSSPPSMNRIRPLFNVGIHDIPELSAKEHTDPGASGEGWIACTTDDILATKKSLFDVLVELPQNSMPDQWPKITAADGTVIRASQRDLRRYISLRKELNRMNRLRHQQDQYTDGLDSVDTVLGTSQNMSTPRDGDGDENHPLLDSITSLVRPEDASPPTVENESAIIEPSSWASIAYSSFLWWASAGERLSTQDEEAHQDATLLEDLISTTSAPTTPITPTALKSRHGLPLKQKTRASTTSLSRLGHDEVESHKEADVQSTQQAAMVLIAYFHRLTTLIMGGLDDIISSEEDEAGDEHDQEGVIDLSADEISSMGLDIWSGSDAVFVADLGWVWWQRDVRWQGRGVECCGVRIC